MFRTVPQVIDVAHGPLVLRLSALKVNNAVLCDNLGYYESILIHILS